MGERSDHNGEWYGLNHRILGVKLPDVWITTFSIIYSYIFDYIIYIHKNMSKDHLLSGSKCAKWMARTNS
jgi:hypothetical protein